MQFTLLSFELHENKILNELELELVNNLKLLKRIDNSKHENTRLLLNDLFKSYDVGLGDQVLFGNVLEYPIRWVKSEGTTSILHFKHSEKLAVLD